MATAPVPVRQAPRVASTAPDIWRSFRTDMDRLIENAIGGFGALPFAALRSIPAFNVPSPAVDITEDDGAFRFTAELPGLTEKDVQVSLSGNTLVIKGEKRQEREEKDKGYHLSERSYGEFQRSFLLPDGVDGERIEASFANGVLSVTVPKTEGAASKTIEVKAAG